MVPRLDMHFLIRIGVGAALAANLSGLATGGLPEWQSAVQAGTAPASAYFKDETGPVISGLYPVSWDVGALSDDRTFEFIVFAGDVDGSTALMGFAGAQGLKFEQWNNTGTLGLTTFGVADHVSTAPSPFYREAHVVYAYDGADTHLYIDGELVDTFVGVALESTGLQWLGAVSDDTGVAFSDRLDGRILGFASYDMALPGSEIAAHASAFASQRSSVFLDAWQAAVAATTAPEATRFDPVSGLSPMVIDIGALSGVPSTQEFVVHAGDGGASSALVGRGGPGGQGIKFEQWNNTRLLGLTNFGVVDLSSDVLPLFDEWMHLAFVSDGLNTDVYLNGQWQSTFPDSPLTLGGEIGLGAAATITQLPDGISIRDPMDGTVLRFASYDGALTEEEILVHHSAFAEDGGNGEFTQWQAAVAAGMPSAATRLDPATAFDEVTVDVGPLSGDRTFEFIVNGTDNGPSGSLMGDFVQSLRWEQWNDSGAMGLTVYGVADHSTGVFPPLGIDTHVVFTSDGTDTNLYVDGVWQHTFAGIPLTGSGDQGLALAAATTNGEISIAYFDLMDGHVLGFAAYAAALTEAEIASHAEALFSGGAPPPGPALLITQFTRDSATGQLSLTWTSTPGASYEIVQSPNLVSFAQVTATAIPAGPGTTTTHSFTSPIPAATEIYFRVKQL